MTDPTCAETATPGARRELHTAGSHNERQSPSLGVQSYQIGRDYPANSVRLAGSPWRPRSTYANGIAAGPVEGVDRGFAVTGDGNSPVTSRPYHASETKGYIWQCRRARRTMFD